MRRLRFSLASFFIVIVPIALAGAALGSGSRFWAKSVLTFAVGALLFATVGAMYGRGSKRVFWTGFAVFGWMYLAMTFESWLASSFNADPAPVTGEILHYLYRFWESSGLATKIEQSRRGAFFFDLGHSLFALLAALLGGVLTLAAFGEKTSDSTNSTDA